MLTTKTQKRACDDFRTQNQRERYDLKVEIHMILLWIYWKAFTGSALLLWLIIHIFVGTRLAWQTYLKRQKGYWIFY